MNDEPIVTWVCPDCGATNQDDPVETVFPMCEACLVVFLWMEVANA
jgi:rubrerythrin